MLTRTVAITLLLLLASCLPVFADEPLPTIPPDQGTTPMPTDPAVGRSYSVDCYLGNPSEGRNLGSLAVTSVTEAGPACNSTYYDCQGKCYGCITDGDNVCVDNVGSKFQR
jgi:hypothetical protein